MEEPEILPNEVPVMPLPGAVLFPRALLPLYIFEERYRQMLDYALNHERVFCVTMVKAARSDWTSPEDFCHVASAGLIRACVGRGDGTSNLILQGLERVRLAEFTQISPFPVAKIEAITIEPEITVQTEALGTKVLELYSKLKTNERQLPAKIDRYLSDLSDPEILADLVAATFLSDPVRRQHVLEAVHLNQRLRLLIQYLREEPGSAAA